MELYFLRHGEAAGQKGWSGDDRNRPLTSEGVERMTREAKTIARLGVEVETIIASPLVRARQTAEIVAQEMGIRTSIVADERLAPGFRIELLAKILKEWAAAPALLLVGHEPDFSETIAALTGCGSLECKKGSLARVDLPDPASPDGTLCWLLPPKVLTLDWGGPP